jgi:2-octaprenyl-6-methoxyphenol hydroxylase
MLHDVAIVGAGPVGATLALALAEGDLDTVVLDARAPNATLRGDRSLALSHGARLIFDRLGVWDHLAAIPDAATPIVRIDVSQAGGFGGAMLDADALGIPALATWSAIVRCRARSMRRWVPAAWSCSTEQPCARSVAHPPTPP